MTRGDTVDEALQVGQGLEQRAQLGPLHAAIEEELHAILPLLDLVDAAAAAG